MPEYAVHTTIHFVHKVTADTPEDAVYEFENGEHSNGNSIDAYVDKVTVVAESDWEYADLPELRAPVTCTRCGKVQPAGSEDLCTKCYLGAFPTGATRG